MTPTSFLTGRSWPPGLLCCDPAAEWLIAHGLPAAALKKRAGEIWRRWGVHRGAEVAARILGLPRAAEPQPGDIAVAVLPILGETLGIVCGAGRVGFVSSEGRVVLAAVVPLVVWRVR